MAIRRLLFSLILTLPENWQLGMKYNQYHLKIMLSEKQYTEYYSYEERNDVLHSTFCAQHLNSITVYI